MKTDNPPVRTPPSITEADRQRADATSRTVAMHIERREWAAAHAAIRRAHADCLQEGERDPATIALFETGLGTRTLHTLEVHGVDTIGELAKFVANTPRWKMLQMRYIGEDTISRMVLLLKTYGCYTADQPEGHGGQPGASLEGSDGGETSGSQTRSSVANRPLANRPARLAAHPAH